jgi:1,2-diacylglycerol 3-alpha-glucosyltransferase
MADLRLDSSVDGWGSIETQQQATPVVASLAAPALSEPRLRIGVLAACPFPANHGTPGSIRELAEAVAERGHDVHVVAYHMGQEIPLHLVKLHRIPRWTRESGVVVGPTSRRPFYDLLMVFKTLAVIRREKLDLLHAHGYEAALVARICKMLTGIPVVYSGHNTMSDELHTYKFIRPQALANGLARLLDTLVPRVGDRCIPHSENIAAFFREKKLDDRMEPVISFGIDVAAVCEGDGARVRNQYGLNGSPVVLYTGVMDAFQRLDILFEAMKHVLWALPDARLLLVTTIKQESHLQTVRQQIRTTGIDHAVVITETQELAHLPDFLQACDVAVVPRPAAPGFPIKLLNYMSAARACVMFASSASRIEDRKQAVLVEPDTGIAFGQAIVEVLKDDQLRSDLGREAYRFVCQHHDRRVVAEKLVDVYLRTLERRGRTSRLVDRPAAVPRPIHSGGGIGKVHRQPAVA